jgi:hypothetical protein
VSPSPYSNMGTRMAHVLNVVFDQEKDVWFMYTVS